MPTFFFSETDTFEPDDGLEFEAAQHARDAAAQALCAMAGDAKPGRNSWGMTVWDEEGVVIGKLTLTLQIDIPS